MRRSQNCEADESSPDDVMPSYVKVFVEAARHQHVLGRQPVACADRALVLGAISQETLIIWHLNDLGDLGALVGGHVPHLADAVR